MKSKIEVVYFGAAFCNPCKSFKPVFEQFTSNHPDVACKYVDVSVEKSTQYTELGINSVPTVVFFKDNKEQARLSGTKSIKMLEQTLEDVTF